LLALQGLEIILSFGQHCLLGIYFCLLTIDLIENGGSAL
jgi:hypothetical protein